MDLVLHITYSTTTKATIKACSYRVKIIILLINYIHVFLLLAVVSCGTPRNPANGRVSHTAGTTYGKRAYYYCNTGYYRVGSSPRTCLATRRWSGSAPTCLRMFSVHAHYIGQDTSLRQSIILQEMCS